MPDIVSRPFKPAMACERCVFGTGQHAEWCESRSASMGKALNRFSEKIAQSNIDTARLFAEQIRSGEYRNRVR